VIGDGQNAQLIVELAFQVDLYPANNGAQCTAFVSDTCARVCVCVCVCVCVYLWLHTVNSKLPFLLLLPLLPLFLLEFLRLLLCGVGTLPLPAPPTPDDSLLDLERDFLRDRLPGETLRPRPPLSCSSRSSVQSMCANGGRLIRSC
jgi:hypothetical protein